MRNMGLPPPRQVPQRTELPGSPVTQHEPPEAVVTLAEPEEPPEVPRPPAWRQLLQGNAPGDDSLLAYTGGEPLVDAENALHSPALYRPQVSGQQRYALQCLAVLIRSRNYVLLGLQEAKEIESLKAAEVARAKAQLVEAVGAGVTGGPLQALENELEMAEAELERASKVVREESDALPEVQAAVEEGEKTAHSMMVDSSSAGRIGPDGRPVRREPQPPPVVANDVPPVANDVPAGVNDVPVVANAPLIVTHAPPVVIGEEFADQLGQVDAHFTFELAQIPGLDELQRLQQPPQPQLPAPAARFIEQARTGLRQLGVPALAVAVGAFAALWNGADSSDSSVQTARALILALALVLVQSVVRDALARRN